MGYTVEWAAKLTPTAWDKHHCLSINIRASLLKRSYKDTEKKNHQYSD